MRLEELTLKRPQYGDKANQLCGTVAFKDIDGNEIKVVLTPKSIYAILESIKKETVDTFNIAAKTIPRAFENSLNESALLELDTK